MDLRKVFQEFFDKVVISKGMNATFLVLIPKKEGASNWFDSRPISLVGTSYKINSKVCSLRLRNVMEKVTSIYHGAFVKNH